VVEPSARFEEIKIPLADPVHGLEEVSAVLGIPRWWPTGARVAVVFAHGASGDMNEPALEALHRELTERRYLSLRFNFPFAEAGKRRPDEMSVLRRTLRNAIALLARDPTAAPAHLFLVGKGLGAQVAADLSIARVRADGLILMGYPLHPGSKPDELQAEQLYRVVAPLLFVQGTRDRCCDVDALKRVLTPVGAPTRLQGVENSDQNFRVLKKSGRTEEQVNQEILSASDSFIEQVLDGV
jgi:predicted alpha/beta-hydrolase family hydrolase